MQHQNLSPPSLWHPLKYSDVFYGWPPITFAFSNIWYYHFHFSKSYGINFNYFSFFPNIWYEHLHSSKKLGIDRAMGLWKIKTINFCKLYRIVRWNIYGLISESFSQKRCVTNHYLRVDSVQDRFWHLFLKIWSKVKNFPRLIHLYCRILIAEF